MTKQEEEELLKLAEELGEEACYFVGRYQDGAADVCDYAASRLREIVRKSSEIMP